MRVRYHAASRIAFRVGDDRVRILPGFPQIRRTAASVVPTAANLMVGVRKTQKEIGRARKLLSRLSERWDRSSTYSARSSQNAQMLVGMFTVLLFAQALFDDPDVAVQPDSLKSLQHG